MNLLFGIKRETSERITEEALQAMARTIARWATESPAFQITNSLGMGIQSAEVNVQPEAKGRPVLSAKGDALTFDGRLDNREDLQARLGISELRLSDEQIILAAFAKWKHDCFSRFVGDWAIVLWDHEADTLYLARDHAGTRILYYEQRDKELRWASYLEPLVCAGLSHSLDREFVSRYLNSQPLEETTPYIGVRAVPAGKYLAFSGNKVSCRRHWIPPETGEIRFKDDREYEARLFELFRSAVKRRMDAAEGLFAHLSGGMDSTSIVCMADDIQRSKAAKTGLVDTVSFYDDSEDGWDDGKYFPLVEAFRGKQGIHIHADGSHLSLEPPTGGYLFPGANGATEHRELEIDSLLGNRQRCLISGLGGDEFMGGVPFPSPELSGYLLKAELRSLLKSSIAWGLARRVPLIVLLRDSVTFLCTSGVSDSRGAKHPFPWIRENSAGLRSAATKLSGRGRSSILQNYALKLLAAVRETLPHQRPGVISRPEWRYPLLDRDLLDFLIGIPREQILRPRERRSLMRRSLGRLLPPAILDRRRKASISQGPLRAIVAHQKAIHHLFHNPLLASLGFIDTKVFHQSLTEVASGQNLPFAQGLRMAIDMELWLQTRAAMSDLRF